MSNKSSNATQRTVPRCARLAPRSSASAAASTSPTSTAASSSHGGGPRDGAAAAAAAATSAAASSPLRLRDRRRERERRKDMARALRAGWRARSASASAGRQARSSVGGALPFLARAAVVADVPRWTRSSAPRMRVRAACVRADRARAWRVRRDERACSAAGAAADAADAPSRQHLLGPHAARAKSTRTPAQLLTRAAAAGACVAATQPACAGGRVRAGASAPAEGDSTSGDGAAGRHTRPSPQLGDGRRRARAAACCARRTAFARARTHARPARRVRRDAPRRGGWEAAIQHDSERAHTDRRTCGEGARVVRVRAGCRRRRCSAGRRCVPRA
jgi:hypothetical protein